MVNKLELRIWGLELPNEHNSMVMTSPGVMTWYAISKARAIGL